MTRNELNTYLAAILTTLAETEGASTPESMVYMALGMDMTKYETVKSILLQAKLVTCSGDRMSLTAAGREMADKCNAALAKK